MSQMSVCDAVLNTSHPREIHDKLKILYIACIFFLSMLFWAKNNSRFWKDHAVILQVKQVCAVLFTTDLQEKSGDFILCPSFCFLKDPIPPNTSTRLNIESKIR